MMTRPLPAPFGDVSTALATNPQARVSATFDDVLVPPLTHPTPSTTPVRRTADAADAPLCQWATTCELDAALIEPPPGPPTTPVSPTAHVASRPADRRDIRQRAAAREGFA